MTKLLEGLTFTESEQGTGIHSSGADKGEVIKQLQIQIEALKRENEELKARIEGPGNNEVLSPFSSLRFFLALTPQCVVCDT